MSCAPLPGRRRAVDDRLVETTMTVGFTFVGLGAVAAGLAGIGLPSGDRLSAALPLVVGAGVGVIALAIGAQVANDDPGSWERVFLTASALGFAATVSSLAWLWRRVARARSASAVPPSPSLPEPPRRPAAG
jgi:hypothetical protein